MEQTEQTEKIMQAEERTRAEKTERTKQLARAACGVAGQKKAERDAAEPTVDCPVCEAEIAQSVCDAIAARLGGEAAELPSDYEELVAARGEHCRRCPRSPLLARDNARLREAIEFATARHAGQLRKGTHLPYILHPFETLQILADMQADADLMIAGVLHDVLEDTGTARDEIAARFGAEVAELVAWHSEDKEQLWIVRKKTAIAHAEAGDARQKMLVLADKLSNLRSMARDYRLVGDKLWRRFSEPKEKQAWYYNGMLEALREMDEYEETCAAYQELTDRYKDLFVIYKLSPAGDRLYQANTFGQAYCLIKGSPQWLPVDYRFRQNDIALTRKEAESLEEKWYDLFLQAVENDLADGEYPLSAPGADGCAPCVMLEGGRLVFAPCGAPSMTLDEDATYELLCFLRAAQGIATPLGQLFAQTLSGDPVAMFQAVCAQAGVAAEETP